MQNVLLVIPADKEPQRSVGIAIDLAKQRAGNLVALVIVDPSVPMQAAATLTDTAFMGEEVGEHVSEAIVRDYHTRSAALLHALVERAKKEGVLVTPLIEQGDVGEICGRVVRTHEIGAAVLVAQRRSWLARFLARRVALRVPSLSGCEVHVVNED